MAAFQRRQYSGAPRNTTTTTLLSIGGTSVDIAATTGWPSVAGIPFYIVIRPSTNFEEKCLATISGSTLTLTRAQDGTTASEHPIGSVVYPVFTATDADQANEVASKLTTKGDLLVTDGNGLFRLGVGNDGFFLKANNSSSVGLEWASIPTINSLDDVGDVTITDLEAGDILTYSTSASAWVNETVHFLTVSDTEPTDEVQEGDLWYNSNELELYTYYSSTWVQVTLTPEFLKVEELDNVYIDTAYENDVLTFDGSDWYNANVTNLVVDGLATASVSFQDLSSETFTGDIVPSLHNTYTLGTSETRWADIFLGPGTLNITDNVLGTNAGLTVSNGVLQINGANQLQVGQLEFVDNNIESTSASINIEIGKLASSGDIVMNRDVVLGAGKSLTFPDATVQTTAFTGTASSLATPRTIELTGDVTGSVSFNGSANASITATIAANSVALGTDTTGNYMSDLTQGTGVMITHTPSEGSNATIAIGQAVATSSSVQFARVETTGDVVVGGNLTVNGTTTALNTETLLVEDNIVVLNSGITGSPTLNSGIEIERGTSDNVSIRWNESTDKWETTNDGSTYSVIATKGNIALGTDTTGNYMSDLTQGTGVTITHTPGEGSNATIAIGQAVATSSSVTFARANVNAVGFSDSTVQTTAAIGIPAGGLNTQILSKSADTNYAVQWINEAPAASYTSQVKHLVKNDDSVTLTKGMVVYTSGANGANMLVKRAGANAEETSAQVLGFVEADIAVNATGYVVNNGLVTNINTNSASAAGDPIWLSASVAGGVVYGLANKPDAPNHLVYLGVVTRKSATVGSVFVHISNGWELDELHNVSASAAASGDYLKYDGTKWINDPINLGTDTVGNYMLNVSASTGISISHTQGEGSTATISTTGVQTLGAKAGNYTLAAGDAAETIIIMDSSSANDLTVPSASVVAFGTGTSITIVQRGTGKTRILAGAGVTLLATPGVYLRARYSSCTLVKTENANEWFVIGDLAAS